MENRTRYIPSLVMLTAAFAACIMSIYYDYTTKEMLWILLCTVVVFFSIGLIIKVIADKYLVVSMEKEADMEEDKEGDKEEDKKQGNEEKQKDANMDTTPKKK